jgi:hypothetical protein
MIRVHLTDGKFVQSNYGTDQALATLREAVRDVTSEVVIPDDSAFRDWNFDYDGVWANPPADGASFIPSRCVVRIEVL